MPATAWQAARHRLAAPSTPRNAPPIAVLCRLPGIDPSDFFNYGMNERGWRDYCGRVAQYRLEFTMKGQIQVGCCSSQTAPCQYYQSSTEVLCYV